MPAMSYPPHHIMGMPVCTSAKSQCHYVVVQSLLFTLVLYPSATTCGSSIPVCTQGTHVVFQCCIIKTEARLFTYLLYPTPTYAAWVCLFPHTVFQCLYVVALACAIIWHHGPTCRKTCNDPMLQHVNLASSAPTHAVSQSHHMVAQAACFHTCLVPVLPRAAGGCLFACLSHTGLQCSSMA